MLKLLDCKPDLTPPRALTMPGTRFAGAATCSVAVFAAIIVALCCSAAFAEKEGRVNPVLQSASKTRTARGYQICQHSLKKKFGLKEEPLAMITDDKLCGTLWVAVCGSWFPRTYMVMHLLVNACSTTCALFIQPNRVPQKPLSQTVKCAL